MFALERDVVARVITSLGEVLKVVFRQRVHDLLAALVGLQVFFGDVRRVLSAVN